MIITKRRREILIEAMQIAIASYNHKKKIAKYCSKLGSVDFCKKCQSKIGHFNDMIKILKGE